MRCGSRRRERPRASSYRRIRMARSISRAATARRNCGRWRDGSRRRAKNWRRWVARAPPASRSCFNGHCPTSTLQSRCSTRPASRSRRFMGCPLPPNRMPPWSTSSSKRWRRASPVARCWQCCARLICAPASTSRCPGEVSSASPAGSRRRDMPVARDHLARVLAGGRGGRRARRRSVGVRCAGDCGRALADRGGGRRRPLSGIDCSSFWSDGKSR